MVDVLAVIASVLGGMRSLAGVAQGIALLRRSCRMRHLRKVWGFRNGDLVLVVCSELDDPPKRQFVEPREFIYSLKYGDLDAYVEVLLTLARLLPALRVKVMSVGELDAARIDLAANLVVIGGPDYNPVAERVLQWEKTQFEYRSRDMAEPSIDHPGEIVLHDKLSDTEYCYARDDRDYGYFERFPNPHNPKRQVVVIGGCHTIGVAGAAKAFSAAESEESDLTTVLRNAALVRKKAKKAKRFAVLVDVERVGQTISVPVVRPENITVRPEA